MKKPAKPSPDFPLYAHQNGQWAKVIKTKTYYFGQWHDPDGALRRYHAEREELERLDGAPSVRPGKLSVHHAVNLFLSEKLELVKRGHLAESTWLLFQRATGHVVRVLGGDCPAEAISPSESLKIAIDLAGRYTPVSLGVEIRRVKTWLQWCQSRGIIDRAFDWTELSGPGRTVVRKHLAAKRRDYSREEVLALIAAAKSPLLEMILLGVSIGYGNRDCALLDWECIDWSTSIIAFPRPKTGVLRRGWMWPCVADLLRVRAAAGPVFATPQGRRYAAVGHDAIGRAFYRLSQSVGIHRTDRGFYGLRHTFATIASESTDQVAVDHIMGHAVDSMSANYRHHVSDDRLRRVGAVVHQWLYSRPP